MAEAEAEEEVDMAEAFPKQHHHASSFLSFHLPNASLCLSVCLLYFDLGLLSFLFLGLDHQRTFESILISTRQNANKRHLKATFLPICLSQSHAPIQWGRGGEGGDADKSILEPYLGGNEMRFEV